MHPVRQERANDLGYGTDGILSLPVTVEELEQFVESSKPVPTGDPWVDLEGEVAAAFARDSQIPLRAAERTRFRRPPLA